MRLLRFLLPPSWCIALLVLAVLGVQPAAAAPQGVLPAVSPASGFLELPALAPADGTSIQVLGFQLYRQPAPAAAAPFSPLARHTVDHGEQLGLATIRRHRSLIGTSRQGYATAVHRRSAPSEPSTGAVPEVASRE